MRGFLLTHRPVLGQPDGGNSAAGASSPTGAGSDARFVNREASGQFGDLFADALFGLGVTQIGEDFGNPRADLVHLGLAHAAGGDGRSTEADASGLHRRQGIKGDGVLVDGDAGAIESFFGIRASDAARMHVNEEKVIVGTAGDDAESQVGEGSGEGLGVDGDLLLIFTEGRLHGFLEADGFGSDGVHERAALDAGEGEFVDLFGEGGAAEDQAAARAAQGLVSGGGDDIGVGHGAGVHAGGDKTRDMSHIHEEKGVHGLGDGGDALEVNDAGIGAGAGDDHLGFVLVGKLFDFVVVDALVILANAIGDELVHAAGKIERMAVGEVAAVGEIHAENGVAGLESGHIDADVGGGAGVGLDVGVFGAEELLGTVDGELLGFVGDFAAAVIALAGVTFGVFVGEDGAHGFEDSFGDEVFGGDELEAGSLALGFFAEEVGDLGVYGVQGALHAVVGFSRVGHEVLMARGRRSGGAARGF